MDIRLRTPSRTPCKFDPEHFDCNDCGIGWSLCSLRGDESLRRFWASQSRRRDETLTALNGQEQELEQRIIEFLKSHGVSVTAGLVINYLGLNAPHVSEAEVHGLFKQSSHFRESSPGMFSIADDSTGNSSELPDLLISSGSQMEDMLHQAKPLSPADQSLLFKRLAGLKFSLSEQHGDQTAIEIEGLSNWAYRRLGWSQFDVYEFAVGPVPIPRFSTSLDGNAAMIYAEKVYDLLSAVSANEWGNRGTREEIQSAHDALRQTLIVKNLRLVSSCSMKWARGGFLSFSDLFQEGIFGLITAVEKFDPFRGNRFSTYATYWINQKVTRSVADLERSIRIPVHVYERIKKVQQAVNEIYRARGCEPSVLELSRYLGWSVKNVRSLLDYSEEVLSLDALEKNSLRRLQNESGFLADPFKLFEDRALQAEVVAGLDSLNEREAKVLKLRFGLIDGRTHTLQQIGEEFGVTRERIRQIEGRAKKKFKKHYSAGVARTVSG